MQRRLGLLAAFLIGSLVALQSHINGELGADLDDGVVAAVVSFGGGLVVLTIAVLCSKTIRAGLRDVRGAVHIGKLRPWHCVGGVCGAFLVACQGITVGTIGVALFTVAVVGGQIASSLLVDRAGIGPAGVSPVTTTRLIGAGLGIVAVIVAMSGRLNGGLGAVGLAILPALAGIGLAWQQAVNGRVGAVGGPFAASWINFAVGTVVLVIVGAVAVLFKGWPTGWPTDPRLYLGGLLGIGFIAGAAVVVRWIGVLLLGMASVAGQLVTAVALDALAPSGGELTVTVLIGCALLLVAVGIAASQPVREV
ncbi:DMT family transporter [Antrihabitans cavernicola]|uniref:DMT family transporter n=1 Tax=Antrihabitans cavernicola TaxID=2495913 RepID=A0A5A7SIP1_9NOCA|nr:DMT family transporter [Spelaeibacter cavernicola]